VLESVSTCQYHRFFHSHGYGTHDKKGQLSTSANCAEVGTKAHTVAMFSKEFQEWNSFTTHKSDSIWCTAEARSAVTLAFIVPLVWASWFQFFTFVLSLVKLNSTSSQVLLHDPHALITAMCCATRLYGGCIHHVSVAVHEMCELTSPCLATFSFQSCLQLF
jgi:hypothetical protein